jgi:hypothetical protein
MRRGRQGRTSGRQDNPPRQRRPQAAQGDPAAPSVHPAHAGPAHRRGGPPPEPPGRPLLGLHLVPATFPAAHPARSDLAVAPEGPALLSGPLSFSLSLFSLSLSLCLSPSLPLSVRPSVPPSLGSVCVIRPPPCVTDAAPRTAQDLRRRNVDKLRWRAGSGRGWRVTRPDPLSAAAPAHEHPAPWTPPDGDLRLRQRDAAGDVAGRFQTCVPGMLAARWRRRLRRHFALRVDGWSGGWGDVPARRVGGLAGGGSWQRHRAGVRCGAGQVRCVHRSLHRLVKGTVKGPAVHGLVRPSVHGTRAVGGAGRWSTGSFTGPSIKGSAQRLHGTPTP